MMDHQIYKLYRLILLDGAEVEQITRDGESYILMVTKPSSWPYDPPGTKEAYTFTLRPR